MSKDVQEEIKKGYEFTIAGFRLKITNTILAVAIPVMTTVGGAAWGVFEFVKDYQDMRTKISKYVSPDLSAFDKRLAVIEENSQKSTDYTRDIKNDLKTDIRRLENVVESVERGNKQSQREYDQTLKEVRAELRQTRREVDESLRTAQREVEASMRQQNNNLKGLQRDLEEKIKKSLENPLANK